MKKNKIVYWVATGLVILMVGLGSFADFMQIDAIKESISSIGFPLYMLPFFGVVKLLGTLAILVPTLRRFKEPGYIGMMFYFIGAIYCHIAVGDGIDKIGAPLFILIAIIISYVFSKKINS